MERDVCKIIKAIAICVGIVAAIGAIVTRIRMPRGIRGYWYTEFTRQVYLGGFWTLLAIVVLAIIVAICASKLSTNEDEIIVLTVKLNSIEAKLNDKQKEIDSLHKKLNDISKQLQDV